MSRLSPGPAPRFHDGHGHTHDRAHAHEHDHDHHGHHHGPMQVDSSNERRMFWALVFTAGFMLVEVVGGLVSGSLALLADAGHMLADAGALTLGWVAFRAARKPADLSRSYGHQRFQVLAAFLNGLVLFTLTIWILYEAARRFFEPEEILAGTMFWVALAGLLANLASFAILHGGDRRNLNIKGAALHVLGDLLGSVGAVAAAVIIKETGWTPADPILSVLMAILILRSAWMLVQQSWHVLMEGAPEGFDAAEMSTALRAEVPGLLGVHHIHAWSLTGERPLVTLHASIGEGASHDDVLHAINRVLFRRFGVRHATVQVERESCTDQAEHHDKPYSHSGCER